MLADEAHLALGNTRAAEEVFADHLGIVPVNTSLVEEFCVFEEASERAAALEDIAAVE